MLMVFYMGISTAANSFSIKISISKSATLLGPQYISYLQLFATARRISFEIEIVPSTSVAVAISKKTDFCIRLSSVGGFDLIELLLEQASCMRSVRTMCLQLYPITFLHLYS